MDVWIIGTTAYIGALSIALALCRVAAPTSEAHRRAESVQPGTALGGHETPIAPVYPITEQLTQTHPAA